MINPLYADYEHYTTLFKTEESPQLNVRPSIEKAVRAPGETLISLVPTLSKIVGT